MTTNLKPSKQPSSRLTAPIMISVSEAMRISNIGQTMFYSLMADELIASKKLGKRRLVVYKSLLSYLDSLPSGKLTPQS